MILLTPAMWAAGNLGSSRSIVGGGGGLVVGGRGREGVFFGVVERVGNGGRCGGRLGIGILPVFIHLGSTHSSYMPITRAVGITANSCGHSL